MEIAPRFRWTALGSAATLLVVLPLLACQQAPSPSSSSDTGDLALVAEVLDRVQKSYVEPIDTKKFVNNALRGGLTGLDPHSDYMDEKEYRQMQSDTRGEFGGLGMELTMEEGLPRVVSPIDDTPAARGGMRAGDFIVKIAGQSTDNMSLAEVVERLRGPAGTDISITVLRSGSAPIEVTLTRAVIHVASVKARLERDKIGYVRISSFTEQTQDELVEALQRLKHEAGGGIDGFVLDLRNDPGGLLDAAVDVAGDFLNGGTIVSTRGRDSDDDDTYTAAPEGDRLVGVPIVVLINGASASASEIVAGALQDEHRATVMGTGSFGKGSVQTIIPLHGRGALRLTTARYYTPSGRSIQDHGIIPDIVVALPKDEKLAKGIALHEADLRGALKNTGSLGATHTGTPTTPSAEGPAAGETAERGGSEPPIDPQLIGTPRDTQLGAALTYLEHQIAALRAAPRG